MVRRVMKCVLVLGLIVLSLGFLFGQSVVTKDSDKFSVIAYYAGKGEDLERYDWSNLTHVIFSFCHLQGDELAVDNAEDSIAITNLVRLKKRYPDLNILLSLGGWGGCETCSGVFSTEDGRITFAKSVKRLLDFYDADGLDLDWEYPGVLGFPGHPYSESDKRNFTELSRTLRREIGYEYVLSFAAGGFENYFKNSIEWKLVMKEMDFVNLMSYDMVGGYSKTTGHHTPLYSTQEQLHSVDYGVNYLTGLGVPAEKIVIGAAFYGRAYKNVDNINNGLYQSGVFKSFIPYKYLNEEINKENGYAIFRDSIAYAPFAYNREKQIFTTFDDVESISAKTRYAIERGLGGIMFWELTSDNDEGTLLDAIVKTKKHME